MATEIGRIRIPVEVDIYAVLGGERTHIGTAETEATLGVSAGMAGAKTRGRQDRVHVDIDTLPVEQAVGEIARRIQDELAGSDRSRDHAATDPGRE